MWNNNFLFKNYQLPGTFPIFYPKEPGVFEVSATKWIWIQLLIILKLRPRECFQQQKLMFTMQSLRLSNTKLLLSQLIHFTDLLVMPGIISPGAVNRIYEIKGRKQTSPLAICVGDVLDIQRFALTHHLPHDLLDELLPGPVTLVLKRGEASILERSLNTGLESIGVRVPDSNFIRVIARVSKSALALTSANLSGHPSSVHIQDFKNLWPHCAYVYDGGLLPSGRAGSTVVDLTEHGKYKILRPGSALEDTLATLCKYSLAEGIFIWRRLQCEFLSEVELMSSIFTLHSYDFDDK